MLKDFIRIERTGETIYINPTAINAVVDRDDPDASDVQVHLMHAPLTFVGDDADAIRAALGIGPTPPVPSTVLVGFAPPPPSKTRPRD